MLTSDEKRELLKIARDAIACSLERKPLRAPGSLQGSLAQPSGAFVTIRIGHELRGCIGYIESSEPLSAVIADVAVKAAFDDPRFPPVTSDEFRHAWLEISVLTPLRPIRDITEIEVGVHGLLIEQGGRRGLLLPQVATEYGWDRVEFLANVCRKAGLPRTAWNEADAKLFAFGAEVMAEEASVS